MTPATASLPQILIELFGSPFMRNCEVIIGLLIGYLVAACVKTDGNRYVSADLKPSSALSDVQLSKAPDWTMACRRSPARLCMHLRHGPGLCTCSLDKQMLALSALVSLAHVGHQRFVRCRPWHHLPVDDHLWRLWLLCPSSPTVPHRHPHHHCRVHWVGLHGTCIAAALLSQRCSSSPCRAIG